MLLNRRFSVLSDTRGFTLLELLIVVAILSSLSFMALTLLDNKGNDHRLQTTKEKIAAIRFAIVGDSTRKFNGASEVRGFISDLGVPPRCLEDLFLQNSTCSDTYAASEFSDPVGGVGGQISGWRGPYLPGTVDDFSDGWGVPLNVSRKINDFPFYKDSSSSVIIATIKSLGRDLEVGEKNPEEFFDKDIVDEISSSEAYVPIRGVTIHFGTTTKGCYDYSPNSVSDIELADSDENQCTEPTGFDGAWTNSTYEYMHVKLFIPSIDGSLVHANTTAAVTEFKARPHQFLSLLGTDTDTDTGADTGSDTGSDTDTGADTGADTGSDTGSDTDIVFYVYGKNTPDVFKEYPFDSGKVLFVPAGIRPIQVMQDNNIIYPNDEAKSIPVLFVPGTSLGPISWIYGKQY